MQVLILPSGHDKTPSPRDAVAPRKHSPWTAPRQKKKNKQPCDLAGPASHHLEQLSESDGEPGPCGSESPTAEAVLCRLQQFTFKKATRKSSPGGTNKRTMRRTKPGPQRAALVAEELLQGRFLRRDALVDDCCPAPDNCRRELQDVELEDQQPQPSGASCPDAATACSQGAFASQSAQQLHFAAGFSAQPQACAAEPQRCARGKRMAGHRHSDSGITYSDSGGAEPGAGVPQVSASADFAQLQQWGSFLSEAGADEHHKRRASSGLASCSSASLEAAHQQLHAAMGLLSQRSSQDASQGWPELACSTGQPLLGASADERGQLQLPTADMMDAALDACSGAMAAAQAGAALVSVFGAAASAAWLQQQQLRYRCVPAGPSDADHHMEDDSAPPRAPGECTPPGQQLRSRRVSAPALPPHGALAAVVPLQLWPCLEPLAAAPGAGFHNRGSVDGGSSMQRGSSSYSLRSSMDGSAAMLPGGSRSYRSSMDDSIAASDATTDLEAPLGLAAPSPLLAAYHVRLAAAASEGDRAAAERAWQEMGDGGVAPDVRCLNLLLRCLCKAVAHPADGEHLLREACKSHPSLVPNPTTFNTLAEIRMRFEQLYECDSDEESEDDSEEEEDSEQESEQEVDDDSGDGDDDSGAGRCRGLSTPVARCIDGSLRASGPGCAAME